MESINNDANLEFAVRSVQDEVAELRRAVGWSAGCYPYHISRHTFCW